MESESDQLPALGPGPKDADAALLKGAIGAIPVVGSILAEVIGLTIPNQRLERIEAYLRLLSERLPENQEKVRRRFTDPDVVDLFEEGAFQSVRAVSDDRKQYIAQIVANGINGEQKTRIEAKRLLRLLEQVDDDQLIILSSYLRRNRNDEQWQSRHANILIPARAHINSGLEERDSATVAELARSQLQALGLLAASFRQPTKGQLPEFDYKTGTMKSSSRELTPLGRLLLVRAGLAEPGEF